GSSSHSPDARFESLSPLRHCLPRLLASAPPAAHAAEPRSFTLHPSSSL
ncbi:hypothetical protein TGPRC2_203240C, partial [Toxoplasma gondii TgCatPRC2]